MAKAPTPGAAKKADARKAGSDDGLQLTIDGVEHFVFLPLAIGDQRAVRLATGMSFENFFGTSSGQVTAALDSLAVVLWMSFRQAGDRKAQLRKCEEILDQIIDECRTDGTEFGERVVLEELNADDPEVADHPEG